MLAYRPGLVLLALLAGASPALAAELGIRSQLREVRSQATVTSTGYECLDFGVGPPLPACPVDLGTTNDDQLQTAPDASPFTATATTAGGSASQDSLLGALRIESAATAIANGSAAASSPGPPYLLVLDVLAGEVEDRFTTSFELDEAAAFELSIQGEILYPDPSFPLVWDAALAITVVGPQGEIASFSALPDLGCTPDASFQCRVSPPPIARTGVLAPGSYTIDASLSSSAAGSWLPSTGALSSGASGSYALALRLVPASELPAVGPLALAGLVALLGAAGARLALSRGRAGAPRR